MRRLVYRPLVVATSTFTEESKLQLIPMKEALLMLGGHFVNDWSSSCTYLVMSDLLLTVKVTQDVIDC